MKECKKRVAKALRLSRERLKSINEERKEANLKRIEEVRKRMAEKEKQFEVKVAEEITKQHESMSVTVAKQLEIDQQRRYDMRLREEEYKERVRHLKEWRRDREDEELLELDQMKIEIEHKLSRSHSQHINHLSRIASEARIRNELKLDKL